ncbi:choice-of-anchor D domain-containing protein [Laspinema palackyanum]|uniref:choice-of-anchor D domain-containing protein n=1 Tax=Laspinema palackyanum TaxID=3231601 RepID=UPI00345E01DF|nr:choice-of-anchor D domain-containing protein [Laspinema sp. D2c]
MITPITQLTIAGGTNTNHQGQSFTATENGTLNEIAVFGSGIFNGNLLIYNSANGSGVGSTKGTPAYQQTGLVLPDGFGWKTVKLDTPYTVTSGQTYSVIFEGLGSFSYADNNPYTGGSHIFNYGNVWAEQDLAFFINPPEIDIKGNNISIANNAWSPSTMDGTDFGYTTDIASPIVKTFTIENLGSSNLSLSGGPVVTHTGPNSLNFTVKTLEVDTIGAGQSTTFEITFTPWVSGPSTAQISIGSNDLDEANYTFYVQGNGPIGPNPLDPGMMFPPPPPPPDPILTPDPIYPTEPVEPVPTSPTPTDPILTPVPIAPTEPVEPVPTSPTPTDPIIGTDPIAPTAPTAPVVTDPTPTAPIAPTAPVVTDPTPTAPIIGTDPLVPAIPVVTSPTAPIIGTDPLVPAIPVVTSPTAPIIGTDPLVPAIPVVTSPTAPIIGTDPLVPAIPGVTSPTSPILGPTPTVPVPAPSEPAAQNPPGVFVVGNEGQINVEFLFDGSSNIAEMAVFSVEGMENLAIGSTEYMQEAARRALSRSSEGHVVISDRWQGARFSDTFNEFRDFNWNGGAYQGRQNFDMTPGTKFAMMLLPHGTVQDVLSDANRLRGVRVPLFSTQSTQGQMVDLTGEGNTFGWEDQPINGNSAQARDYKDIIVKIEGATGEALPVDDLIAPSGDWRNRALGQNIVNYAQTGVSTTPDPGFFFPPFMPMFWGFQGWAMDGYIANAEIFFDANKNGLRDENEAVGTTDENGLFKFEASLEAFDSNGNGKLDASEGHIVVVGGIDTANGLPLETPLKATPDSLMVSLLTSITADLIDEGLSPFEANDKVKQALSLPDNVDLSTFDPIAATEQNIAGGAAINLSMVQVQNLVTQTAALIDGASSLSRADIAGMVVKSLANSLQSVTRFDVTSSAQLQTVIEGAAQKVQESDPSVNLDELRTMASSAAQVMAAANQQIAQAVANGGTDINGAIALVQKVSLDGTTKDFLAAGSGELSLEELVAKNTGDGLTSRITAIAETEALTQKNQTPEFKIKPSDQINPLSNPIFPGSLVGSSEDAETRGTPENTTSSDRNTSPSPTSVDVAKTLFDADYYLAQNTDVALAIQNGTIPSASAHFAAFGFAEGRAPSQVFAETYLTQNRDVAQAVAAGSFASGFAHFVKFGFAEGRFPSPLLKDLETLYLSQNPDAAESVSQGTATNGLEHLVMVGLAEGRNPFPAFEVLAATFDSAFYAEQNADVVAAVETGSFKSVLEHFVLFGMNEGRNPSRGFSNSNYLANNLDVAQAVNQGTVRSGYAHLMSHGFAEGRLSGTLSTSGLRGLSHSGNQPNPVADILTGEAITSELIGGSRLDTFVLGNANEVFYGNFSEQGATRIVNFNPTEDFIQLPGSANDYQLVPTPAGMPTGMAIVQPQGDRTELIALVQDVESLSLQESYFSFV